MRKREEGFTLVELLIVIALTGLIFTVIGGMVYQLTTVSAQGNNRLTVTHELQNAAHWFNLDGQRAITATGGSSLVLTLPDGEMITYSLSGTNLQRQSGASTITLGQNMSSVGFLVQGRTVTMTITASVAGRMSTSEQGTYMVYLRPEL